MNKEMLQFKIIKVKYFFLFFRKRLSIKIFRKLRINRKLRLKNYK